MLDFISHEILLESFPDNTPRECFAAAAIELSIDNIYLAMYAKRYPENSVIHIHNLVYKNVLRVGSLIKKYKLDLESEVLTKLATLGRLILNSENAIPRLIPIGSQVTSLLYRVTGDSIQPLVDYVNTVLAMANQFKYSSDTVTVPSFNIGSNCHYSRNIAIIPNCTVNFKDSTYRTTDKLWYNLFAAVKFTSDNPFKTFESLCSFMYIDTIPDAASGCGFTIFSLLQYLGNGTARSFISNTNYYLFDFTSIEDAVSRNNPYVGSWLGDNIQTPAIEAVADKDSEEPEVKEEEPAAKESDAKQPEAAAAEPKDKEQESDNKQPEADADTTKEEDGDLPSEDGEAPAESTLTNPLPSGEDTTIESRPMLFGLDIKLAKNETLDDYLYKLYIANYITKVLDANHDDLSPQTLTLLRTWKDAYLFLAASEETKKFLKQLKIKL